MLFSLVIENSWMGGEEQLEGEKLLMLRDKNVFLLFKLVASLLHLLFAPFDQKIQYYCS